MGRAVLGGTVFFDETLGSPSKSTGSRVTAESHLNFSQTRRGYIQASDVTTFWQECYPLPPIGPNPGQHPTYPWLYVQDVSLTPLSPLPTNCSVPHDVLEYQYYEAEIIYRPLDYGITRVRVQKNHSLDVMTIPHQTMRWIHQEFDLEPDPNNKLDHFFTQQVQTPEVLNYIYVPTTEISLTYENIDPLTKPFIDAAIPACIGKVNSIDWKGYPPDTMLFLGAQENYTTNPAGTLSYNLTFNFKQRDFESDDGFKVTHQYLWSPRYTVVLADDPKTKKQIKAGWKKIARNTYSATPKSNDNLADHGETEFAVHLDDTGYRPDVIKDVDYLFESTDRFDELFTGTTF